jgi:hypothetical protein
MQNFNNKHAAARNRVAAGKEPVGDFPMKKMVLWVLRVL